MIQPYLFFPLHLRRYFQTQRVKPDKAGGEGVINLFHRRGDADAMDERGGHDYFLSAASQ
jgi:hypothetical protein